MPRRRFVFPKDRYCPLLSAPWAIGRRCAAEQCSFWQDNIQACIWWALPIYLAEIVDALVALSGVRK